MDPRSVMDVGERQIFDAASHERRVEMLLEEIMVRLAELQATLRRIEGAI